MNTVGSSVSNPLSQFTFYLSTAFIIKLRSMPFLKEDLLSDQFNWEIEKSSVFTGSPSRRPFDRHNGYQVLFIINFYGSLSEKTSLLEGRRMEELILFHLPVEAKSEISVFNWLRNVMQASETTSINQ